MLGNKGGEAFKPRQSICHPILITQKSSLPRHADDFVAVHVCPLALMAAAQAVPTADASSGSSMFSHTFAHASRSAFNSSPTISKTSLHITLTEL
jgi:hypothetical protein